MRSGKIAIRSLLVLLAGCHHGASAWKWVDKASLDRVLNNPPALVAFISDPNDEKTRSLEVEWDKFRDEETFSRVVYRCLSGDLSCDKLEASSQLPGVLFYGKDKTEHIYRGPRSAQAIDQFVQRVQKPVVSKVQPSQLDAFKAIDDGVCVCTASPAEHKGFIAAFESVAARYHAEYTFGFAGIGHEVAAASPVVECASQRGMKQKTFKRAASGIESFVLEALRPLITDLTPHNHKRLLDRRWPMVYIFGNSASQRAGLRRDLHDFAASWPDLTTVLVDPLDFPELPAKLGLETKQRPMVCPAGAVRQLTTGKIWPYPAGKALDNESLKRWGMDVWQGRVQPWNERGQGGKNEDGKMGQKMMKSNRQVKLPNFPGLEKLRERLERRDEL